MSTLGTTSPDLAKDRATALTDELFARGLDSLLLADLDLVGGEQLGTVDASGGEQLVTADARADLQTGSPARGQDTTSPGLAKDRATVPTDEVFASGFDWL